jgi:hypothetical protein
VKESALKDFWSCIIHLNGKEAGRGYFDLPPGVPTFVGVGNGGGMRVSARMQTMMDLAEKLGVTLDRPVLDKA